MKTQICDCINDTETRLKARVLEPDMQKPKGGELLSVACKSVGFVFSNGGGTVLSIPYTVTWEVKGKRKETNVNMIASFCPFCGKRMKPEANETPEAAPTEDPA